MRVEGTDFRVAGSTRKGAESRTCYFCSFVGPGNFCGASGARLAVGDSMLVHLAMSCHVQAAKLFEQWRCYLFYP